MRGAIHARSHRPNQDAIDWHMPASAADCLVLAVADGHGSPRYIRSHRGAKLAVTLGVQMLRRFGEKHAGPKKLAAIADHAAEQIPRSYVRQWQEAVQADLDQRPFSAQEQEAWQEVQSSRRMQDDPMRAYGATILAALITPDYLLLLQLGDGDIVIVDSSGDVRRPPLARDPRLMANQTTSLAGAEAWRNMQTFFQPLTERPPELIMLATDGYANSFADEAGFLAAAPDLLQSLRSRGVKRTGNQLTRWLHATSEAGSGDDISVGLAFRAKP